MSGKVNSAMGYLIFLSDGYNPNKKSKCCILTWKSCKIKRVVTSTFDAETIALELGLEEAIVIKDQLIKMTNLDAELIKIEAFVDCRDTYEAVISHKQDSEHQLADVLTKRGVASEALVRTLNDGRFFR